jgi:ketol-acid reductoisomerase
MAMMSFGGVEERVVTREEFPLSRAQEVLRNETVAVLGYGVQGPGQSLNMRDNGIRVIVGQREKTSSWEKALKDGWVPGVSLFKTPPHGGKNPPLFSRFFDHLQGPDRGYPSQEC